MNTATSQIAKFRLGRIIITPLALEVLAQQDISAGISRHQAGEWGDLNAEDCIANDRALVDLARIFSSYRSAKGVSFRTDFLGPALLLRPGHCGPGGSRKLFPTLRLSGFRDLYIGCKPIQDLAELSLEDFQFLLNLDCTFQLAYSQIFELIHGCIKASELAMVGQGGTEGRHLDKPKAIAHPAIAIWDPAQPCRPQQILSPLFLASIRYDSVWKAVLSHIPKPIHPYGQAE